LQTKRNNNKNRYAIGIDGIVDIKTLSDLSRHDLGPYKCYGCGNELTPKLGKKNIWHFAHKVDTSCSPETYLHKVAKEVFATTYLQCITKNNPYIIKIEQIETCNQFSEFFGQNQCEDTLYNNFDLTKYFDQISIEKYINGFTPDILLSSSRHKEVLFIEIAVTHPCDDNKINSKNRILEFQIKTENDLEILKNRSIDTEQEDIKTYNFEKYRVSNVCDKNCEREVAIFLVYKSKKSILKETTASEIYEIINKQNIIHYEVDFNACSDSESYQEKIRDAHIRNIPIINCYLCKYQGGQSEDAPVYCKYLEKGVMTHDALKCQHYDTFATINEYIVLDEKNKKKLNSKSSFKERKKKSAPKICLNCMYYNRETNMCFETGQFLKSTMDFYCEHFSKLY